MKEWLSRSHWWHKSDSPTEIPLAHLLADIGKDVELGL